MPFGLSFGKKSQKTSENSIGSETMSQTGNTSQSQSTTGTESTTGSSTTSTTGTNQTQQQATNQQATTGTERQRGTTSLFTDSVLAALEKSGLASLARVDASGPIDLSGLNFDSDQFISDAVTRATAAATQARQGAQGGLYDSLGGTAGGNTMAALLDQQLANQEAAAIAGARNDATATATGIERLNVEAELAARGQDQGLMNGILQLLRGGVQTTDVASETAQNQQGSTQTSGTETQNQQSNQVMQQQSQTTQQLVSLIQQLISGTTDKTLSSTGTAKEKGGGFSLAL